jgi:glycosyltransferase involved in cell wall biosynthesis
MRSLTVLQIVPRIPFPLDDGGKIGIYGITKSLFIRGHRVILLGFYENGFNYEAIESGNLLSDISILKCLKNDNTVNYLKLGFSLLDSMPFSIKKYFNEGMFKLIDSIFNKEKIDIVHIDHLQMAQYGLYIKNKYKLPIILREHNVECLNWYYYYKYLRNPIKKLYAFIQYKKLHNYESKTIGFFDKCLAISRLDALYLKKLNKKANIKILPASIDLDQYKTNSNNSEVNSLLFIGSLDWFPNQEGIEWFIRNVFPFITSTVPNIKLYIAGKSQSKNIECLKKENIIMLTNVKDDKEIIRKASILICPIRIGSGVRIKNLIGMALKKAIVSTTLGCEGIECQNNKHIIITDNERDFADKIMFLLKNSIKKRHIEENAYILIKEKYSCEKVGEILEREYFETLLHNNKVGFGV